MRDLIEQIHNTEGRFEIAVTGGGTSVIGQLLAVSGASRSLLNAVVPYSDAALSNYLGTTPAQACSEQTARLLATRAFHNARELDDSTVIGIGATAALQTDRTRLGEDRIFVAVQTATTTQVYLLALDKNQSRIDQEECCADFIIGLIAVSLGIPVLGVPAPLQEQTATIEWQDLMTGKSLRTGKNDFKALFSGAFNPPHEGHFTIRELAEQKLQTEVAFEISAFNVDKPPLDYIDIQKRQFWLKDEPRVFTRAATFLEKSAIFPGATFVVGVDTLVRIDDAKYYGDSDIARAAAIETFSQRGHKFLVFGRLSEGEFQNLATAEICDELRLLCIEVSEQEFRLDVSSSAIRNDS
ncbi:MAG: nicotinamide mononucleotide (NMN) deamidase PncC [Candidatus Azotimanducaceae bacterium]